MVEDDQGIPTPRPQALTPSPPMSRAGSSTGAGTISGDQDNIQEEEGDMARLLRTIDFAAHVCLLIVETGTGGHG
jgi:hypothetical protein